MLRSRDQILSAAQMRAAEEALIADDISVDELMQRAGRGAAEWVWRLAAGRPVTVLCGPGNNGGDGYVIAEALRERGGEVALIVAAEPATEAARTARALFKGSVLDSGIEPRGAVLVDCLFGTGLTRPLSGEHLALLSQLAATHAHRIAIDLPSGIASDSGLMLNPGLPSYDLTVALGAWKFAHCLMPACASMGALRLVPIGCAPREGAAELVGRPTLIPPAPHAHKYTRGLLAVVGGAMPGAALLAVRAAQHAGAGYVKLFADAELADAPADLVVETGPLFEVLTDDRNTAILVGPGLGRNAKARDRLATALADPVPVLLDADALILLGARQMAERAAPTVATPHEGELRALERIFDCEGGGSKPDRAAALALASGMVIVAKGPDTVIAAPDGRLACAPRGPVWLSTAGTGDVLAGTIASRLATGVDAFEAACEGVWLHSEAARICGPAFSAGQLAEAIQPAFQSGL